VWGFGWARARCPRAESESNQPALQSVPELGEACRDWRQGDVFRDAKTFVFDASWSPRPVETTHGAVVVSQSCDAALPNRHRIQITPVVRLENSNDIREATSGKRPQYVAIPRLGPDFFADLDGITTVLKTALLRSERIAGVGTDQEVREFAFSVARRFGRFAYPDEVVDCLQPLTRTLQSKARREQSPLGQLLTQVHSLRVQCENWTTMPYELTLIAVMEPNTIPFPEDVAERPSDLNQPSDNGLTDQLSDYVNYLSDNGRSPTERYFGWQYLADAWVLQCEAVAKSNDLSRFVGSVTAELVSVDEFPLSRYLASESLDLDYLSDSRKPIA
jgi:hypothetical protein